MLNDTDTGKVTECDFNSYHKYTLSAHYVLVGQWTRLGNPTGRPHGFPHAASVLEGKWIISNDRREARSQEVVKCYRERNQDL